MLGLAWHGGYTYSLPATKNVDERTLTYVWVTNRAYHKLVIGIFGKSCCSLFKQL